MNLDATTLFAANATILIVMAMAFGAAWLRERAARYWLTWAVANIVLAVSLMAFMVPRSWTGPWSHAAALASCLLMYGYALRWAALRQFNGRRPHWIGAVLAPGTFAALLFGCPFLVRYETVYYATNVFLTLQTGAIVYEVYGERNRGLMSRHGLFACYALLGLAFLARAVDGFFASGSLAGSIPDDTLLQVHLSLAIVHTVGAGAFALSLAYERHVGDLRRLALTDALTGLPNRRAFEEHVANLVARGEAGDCGIALFDIDHFKRINDVYGHSAGDEVLRRCAQVLLAALDGRHMLARIGGEEFAVVVDGPDATDMGGLAEDLRRSVEAERLVIGGAAITTTISAGVHRARHAVLDLDRALRDADACLYEAKNDGRNRVVMSRAA